MVRTNAATACKVPAPPTPLCTRWRRTPPWSRVAHLALGTCFWPTSFWSNRPKTGPGVGGMGGALFRPLRRRAILRPQPTQTPQRFPGARARDVGSKTSNRRRPTKDEDGGRGRRATDHGRRKTAGATMKHDRPKPFVFSKRLAQRPCGRTVMAAAAPVYNRSWLTGRACPSGVYEWAVSECPASQTSVASTNCFFQQANRRLFSLQTVRGGPSQSELFGGIVAAAWGLSRTGLTGTRCPIVFNRGMSRRRWCQRVSSGPCGRSSPTMSRFQRISRNSWSSRWTAR